MAPKKAAGAAAPKSKSSGTAPAHASYQDMVKDAILNLKERNGSSRQAVKKYILANNQLGTTTDAAFSKHLSKALASGEANGVFERPKGASGPVKLKKPGDKKPAAAAKPKTEKKDAAPTEKKAPAAKKATTAAKPKATATKKAPAAKKPAAEKKTAAPKKAPAAKKAKAPADAPAVEDKPAVLSKTSSGRVTKNKAAPPAKKAAAKKAAPKKSATPKKATPKKA